VRDLLASPDPRAALALDIFVYCLGLLAGSLAAAIGGIDGFVFTAGIGENSPEIRGRAARCLSWLGFEIDPVANGTGGPRISRTDSGVSAYVIPTDEELIGRHTLAVLRGQEKRRCGEKRKRRAANDALTRKGFVIWETRSAAFSVAALFAERAAHHRE
jgi:acetate kinase